MNKKKLRKAIIKAQNGYAGRGQHIPSVEVCRQMIMAKIEREKAS